MTQRDPTLTGESPAPEPGVSDRSTEFVPVEGGTDTTSAEVLVVAAYVAMWLAVFLFVWLTSRRQRALDARLEDVESALRRLDGVGEGESDPGAEPRTRAADPGSSGSPGSMD